MPHLRVGRTGLVGEVPADSDGFALHMEFFSVDLEAGQKYQVDIKGKHSRDEECEDDGGNDESMHAGPHHAGQYPGSRRRLRGRRRQLRQF